MKLTTPTKPFLEALDAASLVMRTSINLPVLSCALVECTEFGTTVAADSLDARIIVKVPEAVSDKPFSFLVGAKLLKHALRGESAEISLDKLRLTVESGGTTKLSTLKVTDFPESWKDVPRHTVDAVELLGGIKAAAACADGCTGPIGAVYWDRAFARMVGCRSSALAAAPVALLMDESFLLPTSQVNTILSCFDLDGLSAGVYGSVFCVSSDDRILYVKLMEGMYPKYEKYIPESKPFATLDREALIGAFRDLANFTDEMHRVAVTPSSDGWTLRAQNGENESAVTIPVVKGSKANPFLVNASNVLAIIKQWACDTIAVTCDGAALLLHPESKTGQFGYTTLFRQPS